MFLQQTSHSLQAVRSTTAYLRGYGYLAARLQSSRLIIPSPFGYPRPRRRHLIVTAGFSNVHDISFFSYLQRVFTGYLDGALLFPGTYMLFCHCIGNAVPDRICVDLTKQCDWLANSSPTGCLPVDAVCTKRGACTEGNALV